MSLGLVIPVWNDQAALTRLLEHVHRIGLFEQVVVVDDGSDLPVTVTARGSVDMIRHDQPLGPGPARNAGLARIATRHVMFFDSDDLMTPELPTLWQDLSDRDFDFCIFRHCDSRQTRRGRWGLMGHDATFWRAAGMGGSAVHALGPSQAAALAQTGNFPWNKIWRTDFLRNHRIAFSDIRVHEDIAPHWMGFLRARTILASDRIAAVHHVTPHADRLTNLRGAERLAVFDPLMHIASQLAVAPIYKAALLPAFLRFACDLFDWIHGNLDLHFREELGARRRRFWRTAVPPAVFETLAEADPALALHLTLQMMPERVAPAPDAKEPIPC